MSTISRYPELTIKTAMKETAVELKTSADDAVSANVPSDRYLGRTILEAIAELSEQSPPRVADVQLQSESAPPAAVRTTALIGTILAWAMDATVDTATDTTATANSLDPVT